MEPPQTEMVWPVTKSLSGEDRKTIAPRRSSGSISRFKARPATITFRQRSWCSIFSSTLSEMVNPGASVLTQMPCVPSSRDMQRVIRVMQRLRDSGNSLVVVEHDMTFVRALGVKVTCLHEGSVLAEGNIDDVSANDRVIEVYLGR